MPTEYIKTQMQLYPTRYGKEGVMYCVRDTVKNHGVLGTASLSRRLFILKFSFFLKLKFYLFIIWEMRASLSRLAQVSVSARVGLLRSLRKAD
jgi:hypothetical protein